MFIMTKIILEVLLLMIVLGGIALVLNYVIFFWINKRRNWKREDEEFNARKKQEALEELMETQRFLEQGQNDFIDNRAYKNDDTKTTV